MKVLITGGFGFVGHTLVRQLLASGAEVHVLDNMQGVSPLAKDLIHNVAHHAHDITDAAAVTACLHQVKPDACVHLAAMHYIPACNADPVRAHAVNVDGTLHVLHAAESAGVKHVIILSSGAIYADSPAPLHENHSAVSPVDIYGLTKWHAEHLTQYYAGRNPDSRYTILRLFNVYGPGETNPHIIPEIIQQLRTGNILRLGNITPRRDFIHVEDAASIIGTLLLSHSLPQVSTLNACTGEAYSMDSIIHMITNISGRNIQVETDPAKWRKADKQCQMGDTHLLRQYTGFRPKYSMQEGLQQLLQAEGII